MIDKILYIEPKNIEVYYRPEETVQEYSVIIRWEDEGKKCARAFSFKVNKTHDYTNLEAFAQFYNNGIMRILNYFYEEYLPQYSKLEDVILTPLAVNKIYDTVSETY